MTRKENILLQIKQAEVKLETLNRNIENLETKKRNIDQQIQSQRVKVEKIQFFLEKAQKTIEG